MVTIKNIPTTIQETTMSELTITQQTVLHAAAAREDGSIHPMPSNVKGGAARKVIDSMRTRGLIKADADTISDVGYRAIGLEAPAALALATTKTSRTNTKKAMVIELMKRPEGATAAQIAEVTGWQSHTIRAFLSLVKSKIGLAITTNRLWVAGANQQGSPGSYTTYYV
jgi:hypothetical protein